MACGTRARVTQWCDRGVGGGGAGMCLQAGVGLGEEVGDPGGCHMVVELGEVVGVVRVAVELGCFVVVVGA